MRSAPRTSSGTGKDGRATSMARTSLSPPGSPRSPSSARSPTALEASHGSERSRTSAGSESQRDQALPEDVFHGLPEAEVDPKRQRRDELGQSDPAIVLVRSRGP